MHWKVINHTRLLLDNMPAINQIHIFSAMSAFLPLLAACILLTNTFSLATAQSLVPGIHGMSIVQGVKFTWVIISSDNEISVNLRHLGNNTGTGNSTTPAVTLVATALTNPIQGSQTNGDRNTSNAQSTMGGSQILNAGWQTPSSVTIKIEGNSSLYDADLVTVVASPYTGG
jgi:hypothetical protein